MWMKTIISQLFTRGTAWKLKRMALFNVLATFYFIIMNSTATYLMVFQILPYLFSNQPKYYWCFLGFFLFLLLNVVGNTILVIKTDCSLTSLRRKKENKQSVEKWVVKCDKCLEAIPPRCHHCPMCDECILKRDHHCFFLGICVGLQNEKYFILLTHYLMIGTFFTAVLIIMYANRVYGVEFQNVFSILTLLPKTLFGYMFEKTISGDHMLLVTMFYGSFTAGMSNAGLFLWQLLIAVNGQTSYEITTGIDRYAGKGYWANFTDVFGPYWFLSYFLPIEIKPVGFSSNLTGSSSKKGPSSRKTLKHKQKGH
ncbi:palmitoyltransferase ZDHHC22-like [Lineus longissimus]|uniref:palmitoyltransferase ZDHHC22-like n=1 Tax=Lineus longissimus TaxID=88925 RepID=UPI002B4C749C